MIRKAERTGANIWDTLIDVSLILACGIRMLSLRIMSIESPGIRHESAPKASVELFQPGKHAWEDVRSDILALEDLCFPGKGFGEEYLKEHFENPESIIAVLKLGKDAGLVGFSYAIPDEDVAGAVYVDTTEIHPDHQGKAYVVPLMDAVENEARRRGYRFLTRNAAIENGYAEKILKNYDGRIEETYENDSEYGPQRYFRIRIAPDPSDTSE